MKRLRKYQGVHQLIHHRVKWGHFQTGCSFWKFSSSEQGPNFWQSFTGRLSHGLVETMCGASTPAWSNSYCRGVSGSLAHGRSIILLPTIVGCIQSGLRVLMRSFCQVEALVDKEGNPLMDQNDKLQFKIPNPGVDLLYTYLMAWYVMHYPSLMTEVSASEGFVPFV